MIISKLPRIVTEKMEEALKKGAEARKYSISLKGVEYSGDRTDKLMHFSQKMETIYTKLQDLIQRQVADPKQYKKMLDIVDEKLGWFEKAEATLMCGLKCG